MMRCTQTLFIFLTLLGSLCPPRAFAQQASDSDRKVQSRVVPTYPELARTMHLEGTVRLQVVVSPNGKAKLIKTLGGSPLLARSASDAVEKWKWVPSAEETTETIELRFHE